MEGESWAPSPNHPINYPNSSLRGWPLVSPPSALLNNENGALHLNPYSLRGTAARESLLFHFSNSQPSAPVMAPNLASSLSFVQPLFSPLEIQSVTSPSSAATQSLSSHSPMAIAAEASPRLAWSSASPLRTLSELQQQLQQKREAGSSNQMSAPYPIAMHEAPKPPVSPENAGTLPQKWSKSHNLSLSSAPHAPGHYQSRAFDLAPLVAMLPSALTVAASSSAPHPSAEEEVLSSYRPPLSYMSPTPSISLQSLSLLFQQYIDAQQALEPLLHQMSIPPHKYFPSDMQAAVLQQVYQYAAQMEMMQRTSILTDSSAAAPRNGVAATTPDWTAAPTKRGEKHQGKRRTVAKQHWNWGTILDYMPEPLRFTRKTLQAVSPDLRRALEQRAWVSAVHEMQQYTAPFLRPGGEAGIWDSFARLRGRERQYVGSIPMARQVPDTVKRPSPPCDESTKQMLTERQSLLLDRAWREGWLYRAKCRWVQYMVPPLMSALRGSPQSCISIDGVHCDVLRPASRISRSSTTPGSPSTDNLTAQSKTARQNVISATPPVPSLGQRDAKARSTSQKAMGDATSRERSRSADAAQSGQGLGASLSPICSTRGDTVVPSLAGTLSNRYMSPSASKWLQQDEGLQNALAHRSTSETFHASLPSAEAIHPNTMLDTSEPLITEDVNGTCHVFFAPSTKADSQVMQGMVCGWLSHRHRPLRRLALSSGRSDLLLDTTTLSDVDVTSLVRHDDRCSGLRCPVANPRRSSSHEECCMDRGSFDLRQCNLSIHENTKMTCCGIPPDLDVPHSLQHPSRKQEIHTLSIPDTVEELRSSGHLSPQMRSEEPRVKERSVVFSTHHENPSHLMLGNSSNSQCRPLALHITENQLSWFARQLCPDSDGGGLLHLHALYLTVEEGEASVPLQWVSTWLWIRSVLHQRSSLAVLCISTRRPQVDCDDALEDEVATATTTVQTVLASPQERPPATSAQDGTVTLPTGIFSHTLLAGIAEIVSLRILELQGISPMTLVALFPFADSVNMPERQRLQEVYVSVRRGVTSNDAPPQPSLIERVAVLSRLYPQLRVMWIDAPKIRHLQLDATLLLRELHLVLDASFTTAALNGVERLAHLEVLHVERVVIDDCSFLGRSTSLRELLLHNCRVSAVFATATEPMEELRGVEQAPMLATLSLCYTDEIKHLQNFSRCRSLRRVLLTRCNGVSSESLRGFERLPRLEELAIEYTRVSNLALFAVAPVLRILRADGCRRVLRSSILGLETSSTLVELSLMGTNVSTVSNLGGGCAATRLLDLSECRYLDADGLQGIQALPHLAVLSLSYTSIKEISFLADCIALTSLYLEGCTALFPDALDGLENCQSLKQLVVNRCPTIARVGSLGKSKTLESLAVSGASALTLDGLHGIERSSTLRYLDVSFTQVESVTFLASGSAPICYLNLSGCPRLTQAGLYGLERLPRLSVIQMEQLHNIEDLNFLAHSKSLQFVSYEGCNPLPQEGTRSLAETGIKTFAP